MSLRERFEAKVSKTDYCWLWTGATRGKGYGVLVVAGRSESAHRVAYRLYVGEIPVGLHVLHRCDTPACVNPAHLFLGTNADNMRDRNEKGRTVMPGLKGEESPVSKLTEDQVRAIFADKRRQTSIANDYGVHQSLVSLIKHRKQWRHLCL